SYSYTGDISIGQFRQDQYGFSMRFGPTYTTNKASLQTDQNNNGWGLQGMYGFVVYLPQKLELSSNGRYTYTAATQSFDEDFERFIVDAAISKKFLKNETLKFSISVNDLFNQNIGFSRFASDNRFTQNSYTTIRRFVMGSLTWDF